MYALLADGAATSTPGDGSPPSCTSQGKRSETGIGAAQLHAKKQSCRGSQISKKMRNISRCFPQKRVAQSAQRGDRQSQLAFCFIRLITMRRLRSRTVRFSEEERGRQIPGGKEILGIGDQRKSAKRFGQLDEDNCGGKRKVLSKESYVKAPTFYRKMISA